MSDEIKSVDVAKIFKNIAKREKARAEDMPTEKEALAVMFEAFLRLKELGFSEACYCPKDGILSVI